MPTGTVLFDFVLVDIGGDFDIATGEFTAPKRGKYLFMVDGVGDPRGDYGSLHIFVNGKDIRWVYEQNSLYYYEVNGIVVTELEIGDVVTVYISISDQIRGDSVFPFTFIGTLISEI